MAKRLRCPAVVSNSFNMPRLFSTRRFFLCGKNRLTLCNAIYLLLLGTISFMLILQLQGDVEPQEVEVSTAPPPRIFCIVIAYAYRHDHCAIHVHRTWVKHCDHYLFVSDNSHPYLEPAVFMNLHGRWHELRAYLEYVYKYHFHQGDWFLLANDDNFVVVENLRHMLKSYSPNELIYFGCKLRTPNGLAYMFPGSGIVLSGAALKRFVLTALTNESICSSEEKGNDATEELGRCLTNINVIAGDSRDEFQGHRFLPFEAEVHLGGKLNESIEEHERFLKHSYEPVINLSLPVSLRLICFHLTNIYNIYDFYYFVYRTRIFGSQFNFDSENDDMGLENVYEFNDNLRNKQLS
ncbi:glycoprotein-N-acetylgalactosamine 3-beta-galactosyltransferase 1 [Drosophila eugracilis]|uniref:glycoprotein-N-acetylgalactosamine 3-beta-galactosyltransferase 1 n=1 Tax=Drosophila eugracilis TaxID=29029 RepID=UPI0007E7ACD6|nr:glycoprotein-N-acetylgalactosamine 3-beta-galactosyltransferase 1 [Drosophila eugracilis]